MKQTSFSKIRRVLSELPQTSDFSPVSDALARANEIGEKSIASALQGLISMPQSTSVFANPVLHNAEVDCHGTTINLLIRSFAIRGLIQEGEIVAGKVTPSELIFIGLFNRRPTKDDLLDETAMLQSLIDRKFHRAIHEKITTPNGKKSIIELVAEFLIAFRSAGPEIVMQHITSLRRAHKSTTKTPCRGINDLRSSAQILLGMIGEHARNVAIGAMSSYMRWFLKNNGSTNVDDLVDQTSTFVQNLKNDRKNAFEISYALLLGRPINNVEERIIERMGMIQTHHGSAASNVVARYMTTLHAITISDFFRASQMILDGKRHFGAIHNMTAFIESLEKIGPDQRDDVIKNYMLTGGLPTFGHPEISAAGRGHNIQQDPRPAIYLKPLFDAIDNGDLKLSERQLKRLAIVQRIYQIVFVEGVIKPGREDQPPLRLTPNTDFGAWCVQEALGINNHDRTLLTYIFRGFGWMMDAREQLQQRIIRPVIAPEPQIIPKSEKDTNVPDQVRFVHDRLVANNAFEQIKKT